jgi:hypothetical protein
MHVHGPLNYAWENVYHWKALVSCGTFIFCISLIKVSKR